MSALSLVVFDMDGTLIDSQRVIVDAMRRGFAAHGREAPDASTILSIVGLSLVEAVAELAPDLPRGKQEAMAESYRQAFVAMRESGDEKALSPMYPGARDALLRLNQHGPRLLGVATGKAMRGVEHAVETHGLEGLFQTVQTADGHPSKPHPSMLERCLAETGVDVSKAAIIGDTTFDIEMGRAAGFRTVGVSWGYHPVESLKCAGADTIIDDYSQLDAVLESMSI